MRTCPNCGTTITCGCQDRVASNGKQCCQSCISFYEQQLSAAKQAILTNTQTLDENFTSQ